MNIAVFGASGGIGTAFIEHYLNQPTTNKVFAFTRSTLTINHDKLVSLGPKENIAKRMIALS